MNTMINIAAFTILTGLWLAFGAALLFDCQRLGKVWESFRSWPILVRLIVTVLVLPVVMGLWIWQTRWPMWLRLCLVIGLAWVTVYTFFPQLQA